MLNFYKALSVRTLMYGDETSVTTRAQVEESTKEMWLLRSTKECKGRNGATREEYKD